MNDPQRPDFEALMRTLFAGLDLPLPADKLAGLWDGIGSKLSLREMGHIRDAVLSDLADERRRATVFGEGGRFGLAQLWSARDRMRGRAPFTPGNLGAQDASAPTDPWEQAGISRAGSYLCRHVHRYSAPADLPPMLTPEALRSPQYRPHPVSLMLREPLFAAGRAWADMMRLQTHACGGRPPLAEQERYWRVMLFDANAEISTICDRYEVDQVLRGGMPQEPHKCEPATARMPDITDRIANTETV